MDPTLYNREGLAKKLGVRPWFIRRMIAMGFKMPLGRTSIDRAHRFLDENADALTTNRRGRPRH